MVFAKRSFFLAIGCLLLVVISACGSASSSGSSTTTGSTPSAAATTAVPAQTTPTSTSSFVIQTATATVSGKTVTVLTTAQGKTLYYFTADTASKTVCTGGCASSWPPLLFTGTGNPTAATKLPGELEVYPNANGKQVIYNDHPLYTFSGDSAAGQTNGNGVGGKWFVATPDLAKNK